ncbi:MAG: possible tetrapyrrole methyltransferase domain / Nucleoside triphosphate pyrophosphohydrolase MazG, partial [uncultured Thermomicrobiales bacterium]
MSVPAGEIVVVGLGPAGAGLLTRDAAAWLDGGRPVWLRTRVHPTVDALPGAAGWASFDELYERADNFDALYDEIVARLLAAVDGADGPIVYAVPGHPLVGEETVARLRAAAPARGVRVRIVPGLIFVDILAVALPIDPLKDNLQLVDGLELAAALEREPFAGGTVPLSPLRPALIGQVYDPRVASATKLVLMRLYPADHPVTLLRAGGVEGAEAARTVPLHELDHGDGDGPD